MFSAIHSNTQEDDLFGEKLDTTFACDGVTGPAQNKILCSTTGNRSTMDISRLYHCHAGPVHHVVSGRRVSERFIHHTRRYPDLKSVKGKKFSLNLPSQEGRGGFRDFIGDLAIAFRPRNIFSSSISFTALWGIRVETRSYQNIRRRQGVQNAHQTLVVRGPA